MKKIILSSFFVFLPVLLVASFFDVAVIEEKMNSSWFWVEVFILFILMVINFLLLTTHLYPRKNIHKKIFFISYATSLVLLGADALLSHANPISYDARHYCLELFAYSSVLNFLFTFLFVMKNKVLFYSVPVVGYASLTNLLTVYLVTKFTCPHVEVEHILTTHILPFLFISSFVACWKLLNDYKSKKLIKEYIN